MAYYNRDNVPAENPLGLSDKMNEKDTEAHEEMRQEWEKDKELNGGEPRGFFRRVYDRYLGRDIPHVYETTRERYEASKEKAKQLEAKGEKIEEQKQELGNIAEKAKATKKGEVITLKPLVESGASAGSAVAAEAGVVTSAAAEGMGSGDGGEEASAETGAPTINAEISSTPEKENSETLYEDVRKLFDKYRTQPRYRNLPKLEKDADLKTLLGAKDGVAILEQNLNLLPAERNLLTEFKDNVDRKYAQETFDKVGQLINKDTLNKYNVEHIALFEEPLPEHISQEEGENALAVLERLKTTLTASDVNNHHAIREAEKIIRAEIGLGNIAPDENVKPFRQKEQPETPTVYEDGAKEVKKAA